MKAIQTLMRREPRQERGLRAVVFGVVSVLLLLTAAPAQAAVEKINTIPAWDGSSSVNPFGPTGTSTYGQTITAPAAAPLLQRFTFVVKLPSGIKFRGYIYKWDPVARRATGVRLWTSHTRHTTGETWQKVVMLTGGVRLQAGKQYVLFLSVLGLRQVWDPNELFSGVFAEPQSQDLYKAGAFVYFNATSVADWTTQTWDGGDGDFFVPGGDLAFRAVLTN